jgi:hypothetical protein
LAVFSFILQEKLIVVGEAAGLGGAITEICRRRNIDPDAYPPQTTHHLIPEIAPGVGCARRDAHRWTAHRLAQILSLE